jgi:hypothetical protein
MPRYIALLLAIIGFNLMACCCGGGGGNFAPIKPDQGKTGSEQLTKSKFNQELIDKYKISEREFPTLQYYLAADLTITREVSKEDEKKGRVAGKLVHFKGGQTIEEVVISRDTPGMCVSSSTDKKGTSLMVMSFEQGTKISFKRESNEDAYTVVRGWDGVTYTVDFMGATYKATDVASPRAAYLVVTERSLDKFEKNRRELKGVVVPD